MRKLIGVTVVFAALALAPSAGAAIPSALGLNCTVQGDNTRFCGVDPDSIHSRSTAKTFDGMPIDVSVAFPPAPASGPDGDFPLVMMFHGYAGRKLSLASLHRWLDQGYATFTMTDRGFGESCGSAESRAADPTGCASGWVRLMDVRYEVRDAQEFAGKLADEGLIDPQRIGAQGGSYGGGLSMALGALKNRKMLPDDTIVPWTSPLGKPMEIAAATPEVPWTDLSASLVPNGSTLDYIADDPYEGRTGVMKNFVFGLYASGLASGFYAPVGADPDADLTGWYNLLNTGEPYDGNPAIADVLDENEAHHSSYYLDDSTAPAPMLISNGFTDDLFPVDEGVRYYNKTRTDHPETPISLFAYDFGHMRGKGGGKPADAAKLGAREDAWFAHFVKGTGPSPYVGVETLTQTCPFSDPSAGPFYGKSWANLAKGEIRLASAAAKTISPTAGDPAVGAAFDPIFGPGSCAEASAADQADTATYRLAPAPSAGYTLMGAPTVIAKFKLPGANSQVAARLLDVQPGTGKETLVARGLWRPAVTGTPRQQVFQLHPNGWTFKQGHVPKLEVLPNDAPYGRASNGQEAVTVSDLELRLPVIEKPGSLGSLVGTAAPKVLPAGKELAADFEALPNPRAKLASGRMTASAGRLEAEVSCPKLFVACHGGSIVISGAPQRPGKPRGVIARGKFALGGDGTKSLSVSMTPLGRRFFGDGGNLRVKVEVSSDEAVGAEKRFGAVRG